MTRKTSKPACGGRTGFGIGNSSPATSVPNNTKPLLDFQADFAVLVLARRARVAVETARVFCELNCYGEAR